MSSSAQLIAFCSLHLVALLVGCQHTGTQTAEISSASGPVKVDRAQALEVKERPNEIELVVMLSVEPGWHLYAPGAEKAGMKPLKLTLAKSADQEIEFLDDMEVSLSIDGLCTGEVRLSQRVASSKQNKGHQKLSVTVHYQACSLDVCLPPAEVTVPVTLD